MTDEEKIKKIQKKLKSWSFIINDNIPPKLQLLRNQCLYVMSLVDALLDVLIGLKISFPVKDKLTDEERIEIGSKTGEIIEPMAFNRKFDIAKKMGVVTPPLSVYIGNAENLRNALAHPLARKHMRVVKELENRSKELKEWENLERVADTIKELEKSVAKG